MVMFWQFAKDGAKVCTFLCTDWDSIVMVDSTSCASDMDVSSQSTTHDDPALADGTRAGG